MLFTMRGKNQKCVIYVQARKSKSQNRRTFSKSQKGNYI